MDGDNDQPRYTNVQLAKIGRVYDMMAQMLPTEGRDYNVKFMFSDEKDPNAMSMAFIPHNELGRMWCDYCSAEMKKMAAGK